MPVEPHAQPSLVIERAGSFHHAAHHGGESRSHLLGRDAFGQLLPQGHLGKKMKGAEAVAERTANGLGRLLRG